MAKQVKSKPVKSKPVQTKHGYCSLPLERLVKAAWNYKMEDEALSAKLAANIKRNGQVENLVVRELPTGFYEIVNGNHRFDVLQILSEQTGNTEVMCYNLGAIGEAAAQRIAIELNETRFQTDTLRLSELLKEISESFSLDDLQASMPYSAEEIERLLKLNDYDWNKFNELKSAEASDEEQSDSQDGILTIRLTPETLRLWNDWRQYCRATYHDDSDDAVLNSACTAALRYHNQG
jgi:ParB-like chromosome segregation protein Spo0J